ncbi:MAG: DNA primase, partial [Elusimicrobia bacterium]|nr:DNA primase [Elusimicrobiota bacterium]
MTIAKEKISQILSRIDIVEIIGGYLPGLRKLGKNYKTLCPFHSEKTPSFTVNAEKQMFFCFGCQTGGDAITFVMKIENVTFAEAAKKLADKAGILIDENDLKDISKTDAEKAKLKKATSAAAAFFSKYLKTSAGEKAVKYLESRGIKEETVRNFQIGFSPDSKDALLK